MTKAVVRSRKKSPSNVEKSIQYDLFSSFITNNPDDISNSVEFWEAIPKYFFTPEKVKKLRTATGHADPYKWSYSYKGTNYQVRIQPALIEQEEGGYKAFFPSVTEELVEEALKKILTDQNYGLHNVQAVETWVRFTLRMVQKELKKRKKSRDLNEIKHAIEVMSKCILTLYKEGKEIWSGAILQDLVTVGRDDYLADSSAHHLAKLPLFISHAINHLEYRQFNYVRLMGLKSQLARKIYNRLVTRYTYASLTNDYHFMYSDLKGTGLLDQSTEGDNRKKAAWAFDELVEDGVLSSYEVEPEKEKGGNKILDVKYVTKPSYEFVTEQKAANKRATDNKTKALETGAIV